MKIRNGFDKILTFSTTNEFIGIERQKKLAIYSVEFDKFITACIYDEIKYIPKGHGYKNGNYFIVRRKNKTLLLNCNGKIMNFPILFPGRKGILWEALMQYRIKNGLSLISDGEKLGIIDSYTGEMIIPFMYKELTDHKDCTFSAITFDNKKTHINLKNYRNEKRFKATVLAVGNGANCALNCISNKCLDDYNLVNVNTDVEFLNVIKNSKIKNLLLMLDEKDTHSGCGGDPFIGEYIMRKIESNKKLIIDEMEKSDSIIIISCLGGGLSSGATPVIACLASVMKKKVISFLTTPFKFEGKRRNLQANYALERVKSFTDKYLVLDLNTIENDKPGTTFNIVNKKIADRFLKTIKQENI